MVLAARRFFVGLMAMAGMVAAVLAREMALSPSEEAESIALQAMIEDAAAATGGSGSAGTNASG